MKSFILSFSTVIISFLTFSQIKDVIDVQYQVSSGHQVVDAKNKFYFADNEKSLAFKWTGKEAIIQTFDVETMKELSKNVFKDFPPKSQLEHVLESQNQFVFFFSSKSESDGHDLYARTFDMSGNFTSKNKLLVKAEGKVYAPFFGGWIDNSQKFSTLNTERFFITQDYDKNYFAVTYQYKSEKEQLNIVLLDNALNAYIDLRTIDLPYSNKDSDQLEFALDDKGGLYILTREYFGKKRHYKTESGDPNFEMVIHYLASDSQELKKNVVDVEGMIITNASLVPDESGRLICAGFYANENMKSNSTIQSRAPGVVVFQPRSITDVKATGVFRFKIENGGAVTGLSSIKFPLEVINRFTSDRESNRNEKSEESDRLGVPYLKLRSVVPTSDGGSVILCEQFHVEISSPYGVPVGIGVNSTQVTYNYIYEDIFIVKLDNEGEMVYIQKVPKNQLAKINTLYPSFKGELSFKYHQTKEFHYVFFLDNLKNLGLSEDKRPARHVNGQGGYFTGYRINNETGEMVQFSLFDMRDINKGQGPKTPGYQFSVDRMVKTKNAELLVELYVKKKKDRLIKIQLED